MASYWNGPVHGSSCQISTGFDRCLSWCFLGPTWRTQSFWNRKLLGGDSCLRMFWWKLRRINIWKGISFKNTPMSLECFFSKQPKTNENDGWWFSPGRCRITASESHLEEIDWLGNTHRNLRNGHGYQKMVLEIPGGISEQTAGVIFRFIWLKFGGCKGWRNSQKSPCGQKKSRDGSIQEFFVTMDF